MLYKLHISQFFIFLRLSIMNSMKRKSSSLTYINKHKNGYLDRWQANVLLKQYNLKINKNGEIIKL